MPDALRWCRICGTSLPIAPGRGRPRVICRAPACRRRYSVRVRRAARCDRAAARTPDPAKATWFAQRAAHLRAPLHPGRDHE